VKLHILSVGNRPPHWVQSAFAEYKKRLPPDLALYLQEIAPAKQRADTHKCLRHEGDKIRALLHPNDWVVALDERGQQWNSAQLAQRLDHWRMQGRNVAFLIGGADGLAEDVKASADEALALSNLTFPHYVVRVLLAEALYRAWSITVGHPYHRV
jgi:23S rRNA (pseudouridine1915-N3)-methyltransferase